METRVFAIRLKNETELLNCSSGGAFTAISDLFLSDNNAIVSSIYNYQNQQTEFRLYNTKSLRNEARGSKYMQSKPLNSFNEAEEWIKHNDGMLLFVGMGCQAEGFRLFSEKKGFRDRVLIVDIVCHGVSSPQIWKDYADKIGDFSFLSFRDKRNGWHFPTAYVIKKGKELLIQDYLNIYYNRCALRPSCYKCPFATTERKSDITIGDFWGIEQIAPDFEVGSGVSLFLAHTSKGIETFDCMKDQFDWIESNVKDCLQPNLIKPTERSDMREKFWEDYRNGGIDLILKEYNPKVSSWKKMKNWIKKLLK